MIGMAATGQGQIALLGGAADYQGYPGQKEGEPEASTRDRGSRLVRVHDQPLQTNPGQHDAEGQRQVTVDEQVMPGVDVIVSLPRVRVRLRVLLSSTSCSSRHCSAR